MSAEYFAPNGLRSSTVEAGSRISAGWIKWSCASSGHTGCPQG